jgi:hypothetical protein
MRTTTMAADKLLVALALLASVILEVQVQATPLLAGFPTKTCDLTGKQKPFVQTLNDAISQMSLNVEPFKTDPTWSVSLETHVDMTCDNMSASTMTVQQLEGLGEVRTRLQACLLSCLPAFLLACLLSCLIQTVD